MVKMCTLYYMYIIEHGLEVYMHYINLPTRKFENISPKVECAM